MMSLRSLFAVNVNRRRVCSVTSGVAYRMSAPVTDALRRPRKRSSKIQARLAGRTYIGDWRQSVERELTLSGACHRICDTGTRHASKNTVEIQPCNSLTLRVLRRLWKEEI
jgi:hypothetical protein